jgi:hypothetical protein
MRFCFLCEHRESRDRGDIDSLKRREKKKQETLERQQGKKIKI